jgi:biopolymer transport protein ExbD
MVMRVSGGSASLACNINTTPLIDVLLVLLVALIMSLPLMTHAVKLDLPGAPASLQPLPPAVDLEIDADGTLAWNGSVVADLARLESYFAAARQQSPQPEIHLRPARHARYQRVAEVLAAAQRHHLSKLGFLNTAEFQD